MPKKSNIELEKDNLALANHNAELLQANQVLQQNNLGMIRQIAVDNVSLTNVLLGYANLSTRSDERESELQKQLTEMRNLSKQQEDEIAKLKNTKLDDKQVLYELRIENARKDAEITKLKAQAQQNEFNSQKVLTSVKITLKHFSEMATELVAVSSKDPRFTEKYPDLAKHTHIGNIYLKNIETKRLARARSNASLVGNSDSSAASSPTLPAHNIPNLFMFENINLSDTEIERLLNDEHEPGGEENGNGSKKHKMSS